METNQEQNQRKNNRKLKPVVFVKGKYNYYRQNNFKQSILLKALTITTNPKKLRKMAGLRSVADVYRILDKLSLRKEYHAALSRKGLTLDKIIGGIKKEGENAESSSVRLKAWQTLLKSLGLDEYRDMEGTSVKDWQDLLKEATANKKLKEGKNKQGHYEVKKPKPPKEEKERIEKEEKEFGSNLYEG